MTITELVQQSHALAKSKGWYDQPRTVPELLCLVHSEISEALEAYRDGRNEAMVFVDGKPEGLVVELADAVIRIADLCGHLGVNLEEAIATKHAYNATRPHRHGGKRA